MEISLEQKLEIIRQYKAEQARSYYARRTAADPAFVEYTRKRVRELQQKKRDEREIKPLRGRPKKDTPIEPESPPKPRGRPRKY